MAIKGLPRPQRPALSFLTSCEAACDMSEPASDPAAVESLGMFHPAEAPGAAEAAGAAGAAEAAEAAGSAGAAKASDDGAKTQKQKPRLHRSSHSFAIYIHRVLKSIHQDLWLSVRTVTILDSFVKDIFERIAEEASRLVRDSRKATLTHREIQTAVRLLLPGLLGKHAVSRGNKALSRYNRLH